MHIIYLLVFLETLNGVNKQKYCQDIAIYLGSQSLYVCIFHLFVSKMSKFLKLTKEPVMKEMRKIKIC